MPVLAWGKGQALHKACTAPWVSPEGRRAGMGKALSLGRALQLGEKVFSDGAGLGRARFPPIPQPGNRAKRVRGG